MIIRPRYVDTKAYLLIVLEVFVLQLEIASNKACSVISLGMYSIKDGLNAVLSF